MRIIGLAFMFVLIGFTGGVASDLNCEGHEVLSAIVVGLGVGTAYQMGRSDKA